ncbi:MAG: hypothetical protein KBB91_01370 [Candidatus Pacebacteria bacterium]|nr:hypothetical protein [Candidatus Paceibacterota bacterium]MBP9701136.1 hypothetical protein [Candidatus Paceibacterota bacterium]
MNKTKEINEQFYTLIKAGESGEIPFEHLVLRWISFCIDLITKEGVRASDATHSYEVFGGHATWNDNERIIPSLGASFERVCQEHTDASKIMRSLADLTYFFELFMRFKDPNVRLYKLTKTAMGDFFTYAHYGQGKVREFLLNITDEQFAVLETQTVKESGFEYFNKESVLKFFKEDLLEKHKTPAAIIAQIQGYQSVFPDKEMMYGWMLEKHTEIITEDLVAYWVKTKSATISREIFKRPDAELPETWLIAKQNSVMTA